MWRELVIAVIAIATFAVPGDELSSDKLKLASCYYECGEKYGTVRRRILHSGDPYDFLDVSNSANFTLCEWGCLQSETNDTSLQPFLNGQEAVRGTVVVQSNILSFSQYNCSHTLQSELVF
ncbi:unnamed protein product [Gongylonema pulchrum]|uniref:Transthyretin-like family protein n=1 Tax=Gongylonema pulchrum TaxID=637853 RepID=A0A183D3F2_9BILA|nr:unnamed protein product [Gongylonema pulchrum]